MHLTWPESLAASSPLNRHMNIPEDSLLRVTAECLSQFACTPDTLIAERLWQAVAVSMGHTKLHQHQWPCLSSFKPCESLAQVTCSWQGDQTWTLVLTVLMQNTTFWTWNVVLSPADGGRVEM